ncbi:MAG: hypothetical protein KME43_01835 [Myxacorys chilensis ATA2-1-KO14]|jgi:hypothetical protein|nr:hypothetical protein [Myxacorys chilensis ATA2-1-KO14]
MRLRFPKVSSIPHLGSLGVFLTIASAAGLVTTSAWMSFQFIKDPKSVAWMNHYLPEGARIPLSAWDDPKTMAEVQADLRKKGLRAGDPIRVESGAKSAKRTVDLLLPIFRPEAQCSDNCADRLSELRVYRRILNPTPQKKEALQFINVLEINEVEESFVLEPLANARVIEASSDRKLPYTTVERYEDTQGVWLDLMGTLRQGDSSVTYGSVVYYNPVSTTINGLISWTSPVGQSPSWQKAPKGRAPELLVNRTVALEPDFQVFQLQIGTPSIPFQLRPISLNKAAIDSGAFTDALLLARNGLWSPALAVMQSVRKQRIDEWTATAQAQLDLVARHAKITKTQADKPWASASQQVLANLIDGRWAKSTQVIQLSAADRDEVLDMLKFDSGGIQKRINAALQINPARTEVQTWAALRIAAKQGKTPAIAWLKQQPQDDYTTRVQGLKLLNQLDSETSLNKPL